jgi:hypothetical protein
MIVTSGICVHGISSEHRFSESLTRMQIKVVNHVRIRRKIGGLAMR